MEKQEYMKYEGSEINMAKLEELVNNLPDGIILQVDWPGGDKDEKEN